MNQQYPYQPQYQQFLTTTQLAPATQTSYHLTIVHLFDYLMTNNDGFAANPVLNNVFDRDVLNFLSSLEPISNGTYNKLLSQINHYFKYTFSHQLTATFPTINLHGREKTTRLTNSIKWFELLTSILVDDQVHPYTKMTLLLSAKSYTVQEFLQPDFYQTLNSIPFTSEETIWLTEFNRWIAPLQAQQHSRDIFIKQRINVAHPWLSNAGLHKYLAKDEAYLNLDLSPQKLHQSYILHALTLMQTESDATIAEKLRLDPMSLIYYQKVLNQLD